MTDSNLTGPVVFEERDSQQSSLRAYVAIRSAVRERILDAASLNDRALSRSMHFTRSAVRSALSTLNGEGFIDRRRRVGTSVHDSLFDQTEERAAVSSERTDAKGPITIVTVATEMVAAPPWTKQVLGLTGDCVLLHECVTMAGDEVISLQLNYYSAESDSIERFAKGLLMSNDQALTTLGERFEALCGKRLGRVNTAIEAVACDAQVAARFGIEPGSPMLLREYRSIDTDGTTQVLSYSYSRGDRVAVRTDVRHG